MTDPADNDPIELPGRMQEATQQAKPIPRPKDSGSHSDAIVATVKKEIA